ncbi:NfeD family protein [Bacillus bombysepticus]|uniref:NfeD family protein n=1 Tax=Bacillus bombysepticus TaxID=658666 RepID=UPI0030163242
MTLFASTIFWLMVGIGLITIEIFVPGLFYFIILGGAAIVTAIVSCFVTNPFALILIFLVLSCVAILLFSSLLSGFKPDESKRLSNNDALLEKTGIVTKVITPSESGKVKVEGEVWTANSDEELEVNTSVKIRYVKGSTLFVKRGDDK